METTPHILVVDDHPEIRDGLSRYLDTHGFRTSPADSALAARRIIKDHAIDLVVLDIMMPGEDGLSLCRHLRETTRTPVILLTAMTEETDRIVGLEVGADDYVSKPFNPRELLARIKAVLRRTNSLPPERDPLTGDRMMFESWTLVVKRRELVGEDGVSIPLSTVEFNLLSAFLNHPGRVLGREQLLDLTQARNAEVFDRTIDNQVSRLRKKIERDPKNPGIIQTVWGGGYLFAAEVHSS